MWWDWWKNQTGEKNFKWKWDVMNPQLVLTIIGAVSTLMGVGLYINDGSITNAAFIPFNKWLASKLTPLGNRFY